ncbi:MAG: DUF5597 domain-containing protein [Verrucomicrobiota bacterium]|jgi:hypothetical protein
MTSSYPIPRREFLKTSLLGIAATGLGVSSLDAQERARPAVASAPGRPIPRLVKQDGKFRLMVDGKPFLMLGGQVGNFYAYPDMVERAWSGFKAMNLNTVEYPVYWNVIEPEEGRFDFSGFDRILAGLRSQGLRAILLWFGTWKNGAMDWTPNWVKANPQRFPRVMDSGGHPIRSLSPMSKVTLEADRKAFVTLMQHLREVDEADRTVIMVQVENEPGSLGSARDFSPESNRLFAGPAPAPLVASLKKQPGSWKEVFGRIADEAFNAYYLSGYINEVARAGKEAYPLPAYVNVWNGGYDSNDNFEKFDRPGETYPSGGAVAHMLDLWKANAPAIDAIASDDYHQDPIIFLKVLDSYKRPDNPLLIVENGGPIAARGVFYAIANYAAIGYGYMGGDWAVETQGPDMAPVGADFRLLQGALPVILELQGTEKLKAAIEERGTGARNLIFSNYDVLARFHPPGRQAVAAVNAGPFLATSAEPSSRVLVAELGPDEFLILGFGSSVEFRPVQGSDYTAAQLVSNEQGVYEDGVWKTTAQGQTAQGDYTGPIVNLPANGALVKVKLMKY